MVFIMAVSPKVPGERRRSKGWRISPGTAGLFYTTYKLSKTYDIKLRHGVTNSSQVTRQDD